MVAWTVCAASAAGFELVRDGEPVVKIVLPETTELEAYLNASAAEQEAYVRARLPQADDAAIEAALEKLPQHRAREAKRVGDEEVLAAEELQRYVEKISGAKLEIVRANPDEAMSTGPAILLGGELARQAGFGEAIDALDEDGILLKREGEFLVLAGRRARGTLYAVYDFLESLGCRWIMPGPFGEFYPQTRTLSTNIDRTENPSHDVRYWWGTYGVSEAYERWSLRNKGNVVRALDDPVIQHGHALAGVLRAGERDPDLSITVTEPVRQRKQGPDGEPMKDADGRWIFETVEKEVQRLPDDYYAIINGKPSRHHPNMSNPDVWDLYANHYRAHFGERHPFADYVSVSAADGLVRDERPASRALDSNEWDWTMGARTATDRILFFINRVIEPVVEDYPDRRFGFLVYANNMTPPRIERVHPNMSLVFAPLGICPLHHIRDEKCKTNRAYHPWLTAWMAQANAAGAETFYYDYVPTGYSWNQLMINPQWGIVGRNYPWLHELGLDGHMTQGFDTWGATGLTHWVMIRLYWDIDRDYRDIIREYCETRFGSAAEIMTQYYRVLEERMDEVPDLVSNEIWGNHLVLTPEVRAECRTLLERAEEVVETDEARAQLATVQAIQRSTDAFCDGIEYARETGDFGGAADRLEPAFDVADQLNEHYEHFVHPRVTDAADEVRYRPGGWLNKYRLWDRRIRASAAAVALPRTGKIALDTDNLAWTRGWHKPGGSVSSLPDGDSTLIPDVTFQTQREPAAFFYRFDVDVPAEFADAERSAIFFPSLIARTLQIWINGQPVTFDHDTWQSETWHGPATFWYDYNHQQQFDITGLLEPSETNTIAFRVFKSFDHGGTYDRIYLLADPPGAEEQ
ncbi:MAG: DUF4838 domain-containing protein [Phycisphaeraceae bacterium]